MFSSSRVLICLSGLVLDSIWFLSHFSLLGAFRSQFLESGFLFFGAEFCAFDSNAMSQGYAIELYFDPALENQVLKAWNVLARRQISTQLIEIESRPHITLFSSPLIEPARLENIIKSFAGKQEPLPLSFSSIGSLPNDKNVLFLAPTPTLSLLQFHSQLCDALKKEGIEIGEEYRPDSWIPHCPSCSGSPQDSNGGGVQCIAGFEVAGYWVCNGHRVGGVFAGSRTLLLCAQ
ncbi:hypothetical protein CK203_067234 [Vitis vinifera]|uniref:Cyclic phosphodiesterase n=1 Tax=Vitis vinifera TaxID=29760 RepID=A0A438EG58_VITVI|nr:hypothetical protein CK203_067234 [Vitis vinifera]